MSTDQPDNNTPDRFRKYMEKWEGLVVETGHPPGLLLARFWIELFKNSPRGTSVITLILLVGAVVASVLAENTRKEEVAKRQLENHEINEQLKNLDKTEGSLKSLLGFINIQRAQLRESEKILDDLKDEKNNLEPLMNADRQVVEAIFSAQEQRQYSNVWKERGLGFGFGVLASLLATAIWAIVGAFIRQVRKDPAIG